MASLPIARRSKLYKAGIETLMKWLANTAAQSCDIASIIIPQNERGVRKAKKGSRTQQTKTIHVHPQHLPQLVKAIMSATPPVNPPKELIRLVREIVAGMHYCAEWYAALSIPGNSEVEEQIRSHSQLTSVLEETLRALTDFEEANVEEAATRPSVIGSLPVLEDFNSSLNAFDGVASSGASYKSTSKPSPRIDVHLEDKNTAFEVWCHLQDLHDVRAFARDAWTDYSKGKLSLMAAGVITDAAFGLMRTLNLDSLAAIGRFKHYFKLLDYLHLETNMLGDLVILSSEKVGWQRRATSTVNPVALLCPAAGELLRSFAHELMKHRDDKHFQPPDLLDLFLGPPPPFTNHVLGSTLFADIPRLDNHACRTKKERKRGESCDAPADEFLKGLLNLCSNIGQGVPIWLVVACQTYMDILDILGKDTGCGAALLVDSHLKTRATLEESAEFRVGATTAALKPPSNEHFAFITGAGAGVVDWIHQMRDAGPDSKTRLINSSPLGSLPLELVLELPVMPCVMLHASQVHDCGNGMLMANDSASLVALAHLYAAAKYCDPNFDKWKDMDHLIEQHDMALGLSTDAPDGQSRYALLRRYQTALGLPPSSLGTTGASDLPPAEIIFKKANQLKLTSDLMTSLVASTQRRRKLCISTDATIDIVRSALTKMIIRGPKQQGSLSNGLPFKSHTPVKVLQSFKEAFVADEPQLNFDYVGFSQACEGMLQAVKNAVIGRVPEAVAKDMKYDYQVVDYLLRKAADAVSQGIELSTTPFGQAVNVLQNAIVDSGDSFAKEALERSSSHTPAYLSPHLQPNRAFGPFMRRIHKVITPSGTKTDGDRLSAGLYDLNGKMDEVGPEVCKLAMALKALIKSGMNMAKLPWREQDRLKSLFHNGGIDPKSWTLDVALAALSVESEVPKEAVGMFAGTEVQNMAVARRR